MSVNTTNLIIDSTEDDAVESSKENMLKQSAVCPSVVELCEILKAEGIDYCHWKSNAAIDRSASGDNDLDLLIGHADSQRFIVILHRLGFKEARVHPEEQLPGIRDFYGYDKTTGRFLHIHAHFQLVLGHDLSKNYHLPIERPYLDSSFQRDVFRLPALEFELVVFVIRMVLKHSTLDAILMRHGRLSASERKELEYLLSSTNLEMARTILQQHLPYLNYNLFKACTQVLEPGCSFWKHIRVGQRLQRALRSCARRPQVVDLCLKLWRRVEQPILYRLHIRNDKKRMANGGLLIAIIGGDGSGKTTVVTELHKRLSKEFGVRMVHMGKPSWSWITIIVRVILKIGRSLGLYPFIKAGTEPSLDTNSPLFPGYPWLIREVCTARDRYIDYLRARRFASNGGLVICDRFPLPQIKIMDGPQVERVTHGLNTNLWIKALAILERRYYEQIMLPDLFIVLRVDPETCVQRKTVEAPDSVRSRSQEIWEVDWRQTPAHVIDATRSKSQVLSEVMDLVWSHL